MLGLRELGLVWLLTRDAAGAPREDESGNTSRAPQCMHLGQSNPAHPSIEFALLTVCLRVNIPSVFSACLVTTTQLGGCTE